MATMRELTRAEAEGHAINCVRQMWAELKRINRGAYDDWTVEHDSGSRIRVTVESGDGPWHTVSDPISVLAALKTIPAMADEQNASNAIEEAFQGNTFCGATAAEMED